ncbi:MAG: SNF2-related protein [Chlamydiales bacterium]
MHGKAKKGPKKVYQGTILTTDDEELQFRKQRGLKESMEIIPTETYSHPFDNYLVRSDTGIDYTVELRSLSNSRNSCSCPDFQVNALGTCKHIEKLLYSLKKKNTSLQFADENSPLVEVFLNQSENEEVTITWPEGMGKNSPLKTLLTPYFSHDCTLIPDPVSGLASIQHALSGVSEEVRNKIRLSTHLITKIQVHQENNSRQLSRKQFMDEVKAGKRSLQMLSATLYPYQEEGMLHLAFKGRALLADEMGLGKTIQAIGACELLRRLHGIQRVLVISPASLKGEWEEQIAKFTGLPTLMVNGTRPQRLAAYLKPAFFYLLNYEQIRSDFYEIQHLLNPDVIILDEAQRIKNWQTKTAWAVKQLRSPYAFVLTGTPIENRIEELFSIMQMVNPKILGPLFQFNRDFFEFNEKNKPIGYKNLDKLHERIKPVFIRRLKKDVEEQLPERTVNNFFVAMDPEQIVRYQEYEGLVARLIHLMKRRVLTEDEQKQLQQYLACMRMLADTPYILDEECKVCPKLDELKQVLIDLLEGTDHKIIIFSEWERMLFLVREFVQEDLCIDFAWHTGSVPQQKRRDDIKRFKEDPNCRFFLTTDSGSTGLNLQVANIVINMDLPWNPAKLEQRIARAWRKNQTKAVQVINFVSADTIEHRMLSTLAHKQNLANGVLDGIGDFASMPLNSARAEILGQLEEMFTSHEDEEKVGEIKDLAMITQEVVTQFTDRVHLMEKYDHPTSGTQTVLAVVDHLDREIVPKMQEMIASQKTVEDDHLQLELLDNATYELLQRLAKSGIITIHNEPAETLYRSASSLRIHQTEKEKRLNEAKKLFADAERKLKMSRLLASGDFIIEALPAAEEALSVGMGSYFALKQEPHEEGQQLYSRIQNRDDEIMEQEASALLALVDKSFTFYAEELAKFALT